MYVTNNETINVNDILNNEIPDKGQSAIKPGLLSMKDKQVEAQ